MSKIVRSAADLLYPFIFTFGFYIVVHGHLTAGGGFQGGAVIATGIALMFGANRYKVISKQIRKNVLSTCEAVGLLMFLVIGLCTLLDGRAFLYNWLANAGGLFGNQVAYGSNPGDLYTAGVIPILNIAIGIEVLGGLSLIILYMLSGVSEE